jgi:hypothetical protein
MCSETAPDRRNHRHSAASGIDRSVLYDDLLL